MDLTILFTHLNIILLQYFQFSVFNNNKINPKTPKTKQRKQRKDASIKADNRIKRQLKNVKTDNVLILGLQLISFT